MPHSTSVTRQHLLGGFVGGVVGTLAFGFIHPIALIPGCLLGVICGFYHKLLFDQLQSAAHELRTDHQLSLPAVRVPFLSDALAKAWTWWTAYPANRAYLLRYVASFLGEIPIVALVWWAWTAVTGMPMMPLSILAGVGCFLLTLAAFFGFMLHVTSIAWDVIDGSANTGPGAIPLLNCGFHDDGYFVQQSLLRDYFQLYERYSSRGWLVYVLGESLTKAWWQLRFTTAATMLCATAIVTWLAMVTIATIGAAVVGVSRTLVMTARMTGHLQCLAVTLAVTATSAGYFRQGLTNPMVLWLVALATGSVAGGLSVAVHKLVEGVAAQRWVMTIATSSLKRRSKLLFTTLFYVPVNRVHQGLVRGFSL